MTLDEAIKHEEEIAEKNEEESNDWTYAASRINDDESRRRQYLKHAKTWHECAEEHRQLADWLKELKMYKAVFEKVGMILYEYGYTMDDLETIFGKVNEEVNVDVCNNYS